VSVITLAKNLKRKKVKKMSEIEKTFGQVPANSQVITVCDAYVNCFDAKITGVELERRGHQFLGRYNKPWEYEQ